MVDRHIHIYRDREVIQDEQGHKRALTNLQIRQITEKPDAHNEIFSFCKKNLQIS